MTPLNADRGPANSAERLLQVFGIFLLTIAGYVLVVYFLANYLSFAIWGVNLINGIDFEKGVTEPNQIAALKFIQLLYQTGMYLLPPICFALIHRKKIPSFYKLNRKVEPRQLFWVFLFLITGIVASEYLFHLFDQMASFDDVREAELRNAALTDRMLSDLSFGGIAFNFVIFAIMPAIVEELYFRGLLQGTMTRLSGRHHNAIFITSFAFAFMHPSSTGFLAYFVMGLVLGYLFYYTGNMKLNMLLHFLNNSVSLCFTLLYKGGYIGLDPQEELPTYIGAFSLLCLAVVFYLFRREHTEHTAQAAATKSGVAWVKVYEHQSSAQIQTIYHELLAQGYDATVINHQDSKTPFAFIEIHVPFDQLDAAQAFINQHLNK